MILYIHTKCSTCQSALRFLEKNKISFLLKDIVQEPPSKEELQQMLDHQNGELKKLLNTSGILYREMGLSQKIASMSTDEVFTLLSEQGMLIKRPFLLDKDFGLVGFTEAKWLEKIAVLDQI